MTISVYATEDTYAISDEDYAHGNSSSLTAIKNASKTAYTYLKFDLSAWAGKTLEEGLLKLYITSNELTSNTTITFKRVTSTWDEDTLKWSDQPYPGGVTDTNKRNYSIYTSATGYQQWNITDLLQDMIDNESCCGVFVMLNESDAAGAVWFGSLNGDSNQHPYLRLTEHIATDFYVKTTGDDSLNGESWSNAWKTVNKAATTVADGTTVHIGFGTYNAEPAGNKIAPQNIGSSGIRYLFETSGSSGGTGTATIEKN